MENRPDQNTQSTTNQDPQPPDWFTNVPEMGETGDQQIPGAYGPDQRNAVWGEPEGVFRREPSPFVVSPAPETEPTPEPVTQTGSGEPSQEPQTEPEAAPDTSGAFEPGLYDGFANTAPAATTGELDVPDFLRDDSTTVLPRTAPEPTGEAPANTDDLYQDFGSSRTAATTGELDVPDFMNDTNGTGNTTAAPDTPATITPPALPRRTRGSAVADAANTQNSNTATPDTDADHLLGGAFSRQAGSLDPDTDPGGLWSPDDFEPGPPAFDPNQRIVPLNSAANPVVPRRPVAPAPAPVTPTPTPAAPPMPTTPPPVPAPANTAPSRAEAQAALVLQSAEGRANKLGVGVGEVLRYETARYRQEFAKQVARRGTSMVGGSKALKEAQAHYRSAVDAEGIFAITEAERLNGTMTTDEIRAMSIMGNLGARNADGTVAVEGEEEKLVKMIQMQQLLRAGYKPQTTEITLGTDARFNLEVVDSVTEPDGLKGVKLKVIRALDKLGETRKGRVARGVLVAAAGAGAVAAFSGLAAATGGGAAVIAAGAFSGRLSKGLFATKVAGGSSADKATTDLDANLSNIETRRNSLVPRGGSVDTYDRVADMYVNGADLERKDARKRGAKAGVIAAVGSLASLAFDFFDGGSAGARPEGGHGADTTKPSTSAPESGQPSGDPTQKVPDNNAGGAPKPEATVPSDKPETGGTGDHEGTRPGAGSDNEAGTTNPDARTITPGGADTLSEDFHNAGIGFDNVANAANQLIEEGKLGKHIIGGDPNNYYYTGGSRAEIEAAIFQQMVDNGSIDADDFKLAA